MKKYLFLYLLSITCTATALAQTENNLDVSGYVEGLPLYFSTELPEPFGEVTYWEYRVQNRLNLDWYPTDNFSFSWQMRTRLFTGDLVREIPGYADAINQDEGYFNLSWLVAEKDNWFLHYIPDRLYGEWQNDDWSIRAGRQRINWGINMATNPNDLFNIYSFYDFAYPERPGSDAIRIQRFLGFASRMEVAVNPARDAKESVAAFLYSFNHSGYDIQLLAGYYRNRAALGGGWAGSIDQSGFKGELTWFYDLKDEGGGREANLVTAVSIDHMFDNSLFLIVEALYNQRGGQEQFSVLGQPLSADNPSFSRFQFTGQGSYPFSPLWSGSLSVVVYPDEEGVFLSPQVSYSAGENLDLMLISQFFAGSGDSVFSDAGTVISGSVKWNF
ncbi:MAG: hypothetical protein WEA56_16980 [Balneolaceae bacterium]